MKDKSRIWVYGTVVVVCVVVAFFAIRSAASVGNLDQGQVKYDPGVPPWEQKDPAKQRSEGVSKAPGGLPMGTFSPTKAGK
jgi:hypothetical protein